MFIAIPLIAIYFIPSICAIGRKNQYAIFVLNLFLGWTVLGWIIALVWAAIKDDKPNNTNQVSIADEVEKLAILKNKGFLTEDEFLQQKNKLLS